MTRDIDTMKIIMEEKDEEIQKEGLMLLDSEGKAVAEHKRYTLDMVSTPVDPLR